jgi:hypothetical protein
VFLHSGYNALEDVVITVAPIVRQPLLDRDVVRDENLILKARVDKRRDPTDASGVIRKIHGTISNMTRLLAEEVKLKKTTRTTDGHQCIMLGDSAIEVTDDYPLKLRATGRK